MICRMMTLFVDRLEMNPICLKLADDRFFLPVVCHCYAGIKHIVRTVGTEIFGFRPVLCNVF